MQDPYAFKNLLPAGIVVLHLEPECASFIQLAVNDDSNSSLSRHQELESLIQHRCVRATWRPYHLHLRVRVYLIPFDLPGACGHLAVRHRDPAQLLRSRKELISLLTNTNRSHSAWTEPATPDITFKPFIVWEPDERTLSEIYSDLPSPVVDAANFLAGADWRTRDALQDALHWTAPPGMRPLYAYQRRTVARMLQQELDPGVVPDPLYIPIRGIDDIKTFWLQPSNMEILRESPVSPQAKGGILCEEMGTGKTCMVLGLIMATKDQMSIPEEPPWDAPERPVLTSLALRHFPGSRFKRSRMDARMETLHNSHFPTLVETLTHFIRASSEDISTASSTRLQKKYPHLWEPLMRNHPFYHAYEHVPATVSPRRKGIKRGPRKIYLTSATLVVVPRAILGQWNSEINKHCEGGSVRTLCLDSGDAMLPAQNLAADYDIILLTHETRQLSGAYAYDHEFDVPPVLGFAAERIRCNPSPLYSWTRCNCPDSEDGLQAARVPRCECGVPDSVSPLVQIRWKRLVVDEGHVSASSNNLATLAQELNVERKWIVSGTPTRNLMGLSLGNHPSERMKTRESLDEDELASTLDEEPATYSGDLVYPCDATDEEDDPRHDTENNESPGPSDVARERTWDSPQQHSRRWTQMDREDLQRLKTMIAKFIGVPQFAYDADMFRKKVIAPLLDPSGPCFGAIQVVSQVMGQVMFRHQIQDVERELPEKLPPLKEKTVALKFQPLAAKTYNMAQSTIAVNAVDSQRTDQDYLFHPGQRAQLRKTLENLTQTMFWRTDEDLFDIDEAVGRSEEALVKARTRNAPEPDIKLVEESIRVQRDTACDSLWRSAMIHGDLTFAVRYLPPAVQHAWLKIDASLCESQAPLLDSDRICKLRDILVNSPLISEQRLVDYGLKVARQDEENAAKYYESLKGSRRNDDDLPKDRKVRQAIAKAGSKETLHELNQELSAAIDRKERGRVATSSPFDFSTRMNELSASQASWILPNIGKSASSKVNHILQKVLKHAAKEKFLIFSASPLSLVYIAEALEAANVPYLRYITRMEPRVRQQTVVTFETSDKYRVLLMELKLGARGLNLVSASRIIFCEPVWQGDIESQAIKRAHRIGQKAARIKVSTLVMQGTSEEAMVTRRRALKRKSERLPAMVEDVGMKQFLQNPTFIGPEHIEPPSVVGLDIPLVPGHHCSPESGHVGAGSDQRMDVDVGGSVSRSDVQSEGSPAKKRKLNGPVVRFA